MHGYLENMQITEQGLELYTRESRHYGTFISQLLDSGIEGNTWHRAMIQSVNYGDDSIRFFFYCSDSAQVLYQEQLVDWEVLICKKELTIAEKHEIMQPYLVHQILNPQDILLYHAKGRFLWLEIQLFRQAEVIPKILNIKIYVQNQSFLKYLPEIYQNISENDFLKRYLSLFEAVYQELDTKIQASARQLNPRTAETEFLYWMAEWVGISNVHLWPEKKLRILLKGIVKKNLIRGTKAYMKNIIEIFTGEPPFFVEYGEIEQYKGNPAVYQRLIQHYAHNPYIVNILIREQAVPTRQEKKALKKIIEDMKPAHMEIHLIILKPYIYLNKNVYIGVNSVLGTYQVANLDGIAAIPSVVGMTRLPFQQENHSKQSEKEKGGKTHEESEKFSI